MLLPNVPEKAPLAFSPGLAAIGIPEYLAYSSGVNCCPITSILFLTSGGVTSFVTDGGAGVSSTAGVSSVASSSAGNDLI